MALPEPIRFFIEPLEAAELAYGVTGSVAAGVYGEPRMTRDVDLILLLERDQVSRFQTCFPENNFYIPPREVLIAEALRDQRGSFNLIHHESGFKAYIYLAGQDHLHAWALQYRRRASLGDGMLWLAPPEYVILRKMEFLRESGQEKHARDVRYLVRCTPLDSAFVTSQVKRLGLEEQWDACQS
jgi:hypothetical protein